MPEAFDVSRHLEVSKQVLPTTAALRSEPVLVIAHHLTAVGAEDGESALSEG